ncbi:uncharacterized protein B0T15DRAFT_540386 [Chaetomium strumarium]|uniref:PD-(D/E)XK nuclease-like domain-containing protein n=1 Tax=Chaetomium strumarium TaxID=1170767 RepID=A0AAJ0LZK6_9PEZI|nr:hypothetical protein B0T15DRAFT_540386 [Chaetomium strumarium]
MAVSIVTKNAGPDVLTGSIQLATWVRAHFRHLEIARDSLRAIRGSAQEDTNTLPLPALPLVSAFGSKWRADVATRREGKTFVYHSIFIGDSHTLAGCYQISTAIRRLADWAVADLAKWWLDALKGEL